MTEPTPRMVRLKCSNCGTRPTGLDTKYAKAGGTHYKRVTHGAGIPGHRGGFQARTCGTWVEDHG